MSRILLVDEEPATRLVTQNRLKDLGFSVVSSESGAGALLVAREAAFDAIIIDVGLSGGVTGFEVCKRLKQTPQTASVPVILTSKSSTSIEEVRRGYEAGCDRFLRKADLGTLDEVLHTALRSKAQQDDLARQNRALEEANRRLQQSQAANPQSKTSTIVLDATIDSRIGSIPRLVENITSVGSSVLHFEESEEGGRIRFVGIVECSTQEALSRALRSMPGVLHFNLHRSLPLGGHSLSIYFDLSTFRATDIAEFISSLSDLYRSVGGDNLQIDGISLLEPALEPVTYGG